MKNSQVAVCPPRHPRLAVIVAASNRLLIRGSRQDVAATPHDHRHDAQEQGNACFIACRMSGTRRAQELDMDLITKDGRPNPTRPSKTRSSKLGSRAAWTSSPSRSKS